MTIRDKILVVEDEKTISGLIKAILTANGYDVILASTGSEAFSMISSLAASMILFCISSNISRLPPFSDASVYLHFRVKIRFSQGRTS